MESFPCFASLITLPDTSTRAAASAREALPFTSNHGTLISLPFWTSERTTETRPTVPVICFTPCGFRTCSWSASRPTESGLSCAPTSAPASPSATDKSSRNSTKNTRPRARDAKRSMRSSCGLPFWMPRSRPELRTCSTRTPATASLTNRTWVPSSLLTSVPRLFNTLPRTRPPFATLPVSVSPCSFDASTPRVLSNSISKSFVMLP
mmetsp:Transcript_14342/g.36029  ORF Transcript_14342/g.36029 Transcript_14342/m.36029 type:complete len:207 (+) Transcript_14342:905-1525(+)